MMQLSKDEIERLTEAVGSPRAVSVRIRLDLGKVAAMRRSGFSMGQIGRHLGCSIPTIYRRLKEAENGGPE